MQRGLGLGLRGRPVSAFECVPPGFAAQETVQHCHHHIDGTVTGLNVLVLDEHEPPLVAVLTQLGAGLVDYGYPLGASIAYYRSLNNGVRLHSEWGPRRKAELDRRGMIWRTAPLRDITAEEAHHLHTTEDQAKYILNLVDKHGVTQSSIADALGIHRSRLNIKIKTYRQTGHWPHRSRSHSSRFH